MEAPANLSRQIKFLCRMFDQLVKPVLSYGCQIWGPDIFHNKLDIDHVINRTSNPLEGVHIDFMRHLGGLPKSSPLWILYNEFQRTPLHFHWMALCARFWVKAITPAMDNTLHTNLLLKESMKDNIKLMLDGSTDCWVAKFLQSMKCIGAISAEALTSCATVEDCISLPITEP